MVEFIQYTVGTDQGLFGSVSVGSGLSRGVMVFWFIALWGRY